MSYAPIDKELCPYRQRIEEDPSSTQLISSDKRHCDNLRNEADLLMSKWYNYACKSDVAYNVSSIEIFQEQLDLGSCKGDWNIHYKKKEKAPNLNHALHLLNNLETPKKDTG